MHPPDAPAYLVLAAPPRAAQQHRPELVPEGAEAAAAAAPGGGVGVGLGLLSTTSLCTAHAHVPLFESLVGRDRREKELQLRPQKGAGARRIAFFGEQLSRPDDGVKVGLKPRVQ